MKHFLDHFDIQEIVCKIDSVLEKLQSMNRIFQEADSYYTNIFEELKKSNEHLDDEEDKPQGANGTQITLLFIYNVIFDRSGVIHLQDIHISISFYKFCMIYRLRQKSAPAITLYAHALRIQRDVVIVHGWEYQCVTIFPV